MRVVDEPVRWFEVLRARLGVERLLREAARICDLALQAAQIQDVFSDRTGTASLVNGQIRVPIAEIGGWKMQSLPKGQPIQITLPSSGALVDIER